MIKIENKEDEFNNLE